MMRIAIAVFAILFCTTLAGWAGSSGSATNLSDAIPSRTPPRNSNGGGGDGNDLPKYKTVSLGCSTGVIYTMVTNNSGITIPAKATITVTGVQAECTQTAKGPLAKGKSIKLLGCSEKVTDCKASAKWAL